VESFTVTIAAIQDHKIKIISPAAYNNMCKTDESK